MMKASKQHTNSKTQIISKLIFKLGFLPTRAKHIEINHHFVRDHVQKGIIDLQFISTNEQLSDIFTEPLVEERFHYLRELLGMILIE